MELDIMGVVGMVVGVVMNSEESKKDSEEIKCEIQGEVTVQPRTRCTMTPITPPSYWLRIRGPSNAVTRLPRGELRRRVGQSLPLVHEVLGLPRQSLRYRRLAYYRHIAESKPDPLCTPSNSAALVNLAARIKLPNLALRGVYHEPEA
jgi:hypothetical protein